MQVTLTEIQTKCPELLADKNYHLIAAAVNVGRTRPNSVEIGNGTILEKLGLALGTQVLDVIHATPAYKYVLTLLDSGRLKIGTPLAQAAVQAFVPALLTQVQADSIKDLGLDPDPVTWQQCNAVVDGAQ